MKIAVVVHVFYPEVFVEIDRLLSSLDEKVDIFLSSPHRGVLNLYKEYNVNYVENVGMDVFPFLYLVKKYKLWNYDLVIKLHTKNNNNELSKIMMDIYLDSLLSNDSLSHLISSAESNPMFGMWGPLVYARYVDKLMYMNRENIDLLQKNTDQYASLSNLIFFAGTMFCIRGEILRFVDIQYNQLNMLFLLSLNGETGGDGTLAHAFERFFSVAARAQSYSVALILSKQFSTTNQKLILGEEFFNKPIYKNYFQLGSRDSVKRWMNLSGYLKIDYSSILDLNKFSSHPSLFDQSAEKKINYVAYYLFFSDYLPAIDMGEINFSSSMYILERLDVYRSGVPSAFHYLTKKKKESLLFFTDKWFLNVVRKYIPSRVSFNVSKNKSIRLLKYNFIFDCSSLSKRISNVELSVDVFIKQYVPELKRIRDILYLQLAHDDYIGAKRTAIDFIKDYPLTPDLLEIIAVSYTLEKKPDQAKAFWDIYQKAKSDKDFLYSFESKRLVKYDQEYEKDKIFKAIAYSESQNDIGAADIQFSNKKICIYTSLFGNYDDLPLIKCKIPEHIDFLAFTDKHHDDAHKAWNQIVCDSNQKSHNLSAKQYKILPHNYLKEYDFSLFVDANTVFINDIEAMITRLHKLGDFVMWRHPFRASIFMEACAILASNRADPTTILQQLEIYDREGMKGNTGLCEGSFIWRNHSAKKVCQFMEEWWEHIQTYSHRDQLSLCFLMWKRNFYPDLMDDKYGTSRKNIFFYKKLHKVEEVAKQRSEVVSYF